MSSWFEHLDERLASWDAEGLTRRLRPADGEGVHLQVEGRPIVSFASNDYLGLSQHPRVKAAACAAIEAHGTGATASRLICGTRPEHVQLEDALVRFKRSDACLVFSTGYQVPLALLPALCVEGPCAMVLDRLAHACLVDGARLSGTRVRTFRHNDPGDLAATLEKERVHATEGRLLVVIESLYSMDGDVAPLVEMHEVARRFDAWLLVDEAHATGVLGPDGRGALADAFTGPLPGDVLAMGTLSKALGSQGGYLCAAQRVIDLLVNAGRAFLFSTGLAPAAAAAALEALVLLQEDDGPRRRLLERADALRGRLRDAGWAVSGSPGPILPLTVGAERRATEIADRLLAKGFWVPAIRYPTVKRGAARLRVSLSSAHEEHEIQGLVEALAEQR